MIRYIIMLLVVIPTILYAQNIDLSSLDKNKIKNRLKSVDTGGSILDGVITKAAVSVANSLKEASTSSPSSYCFASGMSAGMENLCLGISKNESTYCFASGLSKGQKNLCLAVANRDSSYCFASGMSAGMENLCLGISK